MEVSLCALCRSRLAVLISRLLLSKISSAAGSDSPAAMRWHEPMKSEALKIRERFVINRIPYDVFVVIINRIRFIIHMNEFNRAKNPQNKADLRVKIIP